MSFDLTLTITGLCLFVPDDKPADGGGKRLHVLLMDHGEKSHPGHPPDRDSLHHQMLIYDRRYSREPGDKRQLICRNIRDTRLLLKHNIDSKDPIRLETLPKQLADLKQIAWLRRIKRKRLEEVRPRGVASRLFLYSGSGKNGSKHAVWKGTTPLKKWQGKLTTWVSWTISDLTSKDEDGKEAFVLDFQSLGNGASERVTLYPHEGRIHAYIYNSICRDLPPEQKDDPKQVQAEHFEAYYQPLTSYWKTIPTLVQRPKDLDFPLADGECPRKPCDSEALDVPRTSRSVLCVMARVNVT